MRRITGATADIYIRRVQDHVWEHATSYDRLVQRWIQADPTNYPLLEELHTKMGKLAWAIFSCTGTKEWQVLAVGHDKDRVAYRSPESRFHPRDKATANIQRITVMLVRPVPEFDG